MAELAGTLTGRRGAGGGALGPQGAWQLPCQGLGKGTLT